MPATTLKKRKEKSSIADAATGNGNIQITLQLPIGEPPAADEYVQRDLHVEVQARETHQATALRRLFKGLDNVGARLRNGRRVISGADAVKWLGEQIDDEIRKLET